MQFLFLQVSASCRVVDLQVSIFKNGRILHFSHTKHGKTPYRYTDSCKQFFYGKRLGNIIIRTCVQRFDLIRIFASRTDHNDRHIGPGTDFFDHIYTFHVRQSQVQQNNIWLMGGCFHNCSGAIFRSKIFIVMCF